MKMEIPFFGKHKKAGRVVAGVALTGAVTAGSAAAYANMQDKARDASKDLTTIENSQKKPDQVTTTTTTFPETPPSSVAPAENKSTVGTTASSGTAATAENDHPSGDSGSRIVNNGDGTWTPVDPVTNLPIGSPQPMYPDTGSVPPDIATGNGSDTTHGGADGSVQNGTPNTQNNNIGQTGSSS